MGNNIFKEIKSFSLLITKFGFIPKLTTGTLFAKIFPSLSRILALKFSFLDIFLISGLVCKLNRITFDEKIIAIIKKTKNINVILSNDILRLDFDRLWARIRIKIPIQPKSDIYTNEYNKKSKKNKDDVYIFVNRKHHPHKPIILSSGYILYDDDWYTYRNKKIKFT